VKVKNPAGRESPPVPPTGGFGRVGVARPARAGRALILLKIGSSFVVNLCHQG